MNRLSLCIILLLGCNAVWAEELYRWVEADGSITFSPKPPPAGVKFKAVEAKAAVLPGIAVQQRSAAGTGPASNGSMQAQLAAAMLAEQNANAGKPAQAPQKIAYAPSNGEQQPSGISAPAANVKPEQGNGIRLARDSTLPQHSVTSNKKRKHCVDLGKRVVSLERRLRSGLSADEMDSTVLSIARYQQSFDQHCAE